LRADFCSLYLFLQKVDDRQLMKEFLPEFLPELLEAADFNLYMFPHRLIHTHMPGRRVSKSDLICFPSFITQIRPIMTLKSNNARTYLQPHYGNGVFGNVYLAFSWTKLRGKHCRHPIAVMGVVDTFGQSL
jgi:hypothetical protein